MRFIHFFICLSPIGVKMLPAYLQMCLKFYRNRKLGSITPVEYAPLIMVMSSRDFFLPKSSPKFILFCLRAATMTMASLRIYDDPSMKARLLINAINVGLF